MKKMFRRLFFSMVVSVASFNVFANESVFPVTVSTTAAPTCAANGAYDHNESKSSFCASSPVTGQGFPAYVECSCLNNKPPQPDAVCRNTKLVYLGMMARYHTLAQACKENMGPGVSMQECEDQWNCFMYGTKGTNATQKISDGECFGLSDTAGC